MLYLIEYQIPDAKTVRCQRYVDSEIARAHKDRIAWEMKMWKGTQIPLGHVVLLQAKNDDSLKRTHGRYFPLPAFED